MKVVSNGRYTSWTYLFSMETVVVCVAARIINQKKTNCKTKLEQMKTRAISTSSPNRLPPRVLSRIWGRKKQFNRPSPFIYYINNESQRLLRQYVIIQLHEK